MLRERERERERERASFFSPSVPTFIIVEETIDLTTSIKYEIQYYSPLNRLYFFNDGKISLLDIGK